MISLVNLLLEVSIDQLRQDWVESGKISPEVFNRIVRTCENKSNWATWLVKRVSQGLIADEDIELWQDYMTTFERYKQRFQIKDINQIKTADQIADFRQECVNVQQAADKRIANTGGEKLKGSKDERKREVDQFRLPDYKNTVTGEVFEVFKLPKKTPGNQKYAIELGTGTTWCTASRGNSNLYKTYNQQGPLYIFISKSDPTEKYQIHVETDQFKDKKDKEIDYSLDKFLDFYGYLQKVDNIVLSRQAKKYIDIANTCREGKKYPAEPEKYKLSYQVKPGENWYFFKAPYVDKISTILSITGTESFGNIFNYPAVFVSNTGYCMFSSGDNTIYGVSTVDKEPNSEPLRYFKQITSKQYTVFKKMLKSKGYFFDNDDVAILLDKNLPSLKDFKIGEVDGNPIYYFDPKKGSKAKAEKQFGRRIESDSAVFRFKDRFMYIAKVGDFIMYSFQTAREVNELLEYFNIIKQVVPFKDRISKIQKRFQDLKTFLEKLQELRRVPTTVPDTEELIFPAGMVKFPENCIYCLIGVAKTLATVCAYTGIPEKLYHVNSSHQYFIGKNSKGIACIFDEYGYSITNKTRLPEPADKVASRFQEVGLELPTVVKKALDVQRKVKSEEIEAPVPRLLRSKADELKQCSVASLGLTRHYVCQGLEGTWQTLGPNIERSSPSTAVEIEDYIASYNCNRTRVVIYGTASNWQAFITVGVGDRILKVWTRTGQGIGISWKSKELSDEDWNKVQRKIPEGTVLLERHSPEISIERFQLLAGIIR